jgi:hypothetical protein
VRLGALEGGVELEEVDRRIRRSWNRLVDADAVTAARNTMLVVASIADELVPTIDAFAAPAPRRDVSAVARRLEPHVGALELTHGEIASGRRVDGASADACTEREQEHATHPETKPIASRRHSDGRAWSMDRPT